MSQLGTRSGSQILRTFLPQQTADLKGGIYRVTEWSGAVPIQVDQDIVRRRLLREITPWALARTDGGVAADLRAGAYIEVVELDDRRGVKVEPYPEVWLCRTCRRVGKQRSATCRCGLKRWGQLHFVGFHGCGAIIEPWIRRCKEHDDVKLISPRSAQAKDIKFICPECNIDLMTGLGFRRCPACGQGNINWNVHKARSVYVPRGTVLVNPPRPDRMKDLLAAGGARKALSWVVEGMSARSPSAMPDKPTRGAFIENLLRQQMDQTFAEKMAAIAEEEGQLAPADGTDDIDQLISDRRQEAEHDAVDIAMALSEGRIPASSLIGSAGVDTVLSARYANDYPSALARAGLLGIDLVERFPVLNVMYGYTRGGGDADCRLVPFRHPRGGYKLHGDMSETEALLIRLDPVRVARWLMVRGHTLPGITSQDVEARRARIAILEAAEIPVPGDWPQTATVGSDLLALVHSFSHRVIRQTAVYAGIDRESLSEYLVPLHLGFFVYAAARGDFVLGGLQAVFETELNVLVGSVIDGEHRCALDPGCARGAGACLACLHIGEPSCRCFNTFLDRKTLFGRTGYLALTTA